MASIHDVPTNPLIEKVAEELKGLKEITPPAWAQFVKTGVHKQRPPVQENWWQIRAAAVLRTICKDGPVGVSKLRSKYGGSKRMGRRPEKFMKGSGSVIRKVLQQLEAAGLIKKIEKSLSKGRIITPQGQALLDKIATKIAKEKK